MTRELKSKDHDAARVTFDAEGAVRAMRFGTYGTLAAGAAAVAANTLPLLAIGAIPLAGGVGAAALGYFTAKDVRRARNASKASTDTR